MNPQVEHEPLMTPAEVAAVLRVEPKAIRKWADDGKLWCTRTPGGVRRYREADIRAIVAGTYQAGAR